ncbi:MAG: FAD-binding protein [Candidatus Wallbacteria bacterium]|nr:FAD-binding protein [Candidatus Wallbacteria bacterium]
MFTPLRLFVCLKQVPDTAEISIDPVTGSLKREGVDSIISPFDMHALEEAVRIREEHGGTVTVISMGPPQAADALAEAIARGADNAYLITDRAFAGSDTWCTSLILSRAIEHLGGADLIFCGKQAIDGDTAQVGPGIAEHLGIPQIDSVNRVVALGKDKITVQSLCGNGSDTIQSGLPLLITAVKELNTPRQASLADWSRALVSEIRTLDAATLGFETSQVGLSGSPTRVRSIRTVAYSKKTVFLTGNTEEICRQILDLLKIKKTISKIDYNVQRCAVNDARLILVIGELDAEITALTRELLSIAAVLAAQRCARVGVIFCGHQLNLPLNEIQADSVYLLDDQKLSIFDARVHCSAIAQLCKSLQPEIILGGASFQGRALLPRISVKLRTGLTADCTELDLDEKGLLLQIRPALGGNILATITCERHKPQMATVRAGVFKQVNHFPGGCKPEILTPAVLIEEESGFRIIRHESYSCPEKDSGLMISGGIGIGSREAFSGLKKLAEITGASLGASRAAVDAGWIEYRHQVGQTGKTVQPEHYLSFGISGAVQHLVGMQSAGIVISINKDPAAPIFSISDYAVVADCFPIMEIMLKMVAAEKL